MGKGRDKKPGSVDSLSFEQLAGLSGHHHFLEDLAGQLIA